MTSWTQPTNEMVEKALSSVKKETDRQYFFSRLKNPLWVEALTERGYFTSPPGIKQLPNGYVQYPDWHELTYLVNIAEEVADNVVDTVLRIPKTDNPRIYDGILDIALNLKGSDSAKLLNKIIEYTELKHQFFAHRFPELLCHWLNQGNIIQSLEVAKRLIPFQEDPRSSEKRRLRKANPNAWTSRLEPAPRFGEWEYQQILKKGICSLAEHEPYETAQILIDATTNMIWLRTHQEDIDKGRDEDYSEIWCRRLDRPDRDHQDSQEILVHTMFYACEQVFEKAPHSIEALDQALRNQRWKVFKRLRQHLYALHPNDQTLPWIREFILGYQDYGKLELHYEFQLMIRNACEYFGPRLLSEAEKREIFDAILNGPSKEDFREWMGDQYSEEAFRQRQRYFHRKQLRPFAALLGNDHQRYFVELGREDQKEHIADEDYLSYGHVRGGFVTYQSPKTAEELTTLSDVELLAFLNDWDGEHRDKDNWLIEVNIVALAGIFQSLFKDIIAPDEKRLAFWMEHRENIERPVYISVMTKAMQEFIKEQKFDKLDQWIEFCMWILSHPDTERKEGEPEPSDESSEYPEWGNSRRAVVDFVDACLNKEFNAPIGTRSGLAKLLRNLCTQFDWRLDRNRPLLLNCDDPLTEAINNTRSRAFESLINFGFWVRRCSPEDTVPEVTEVLDERLEQGSNVTLTKPEHALLGMHFGNICLLNQSWAVDNKKILFPRDNIPVWRGAFDSFLRFNRPAKLTFNILREDFEFALNHLEAFDRTEDSREEFIDSLGEHLFSYYLWQVYPLTGDESFLARFYEKTVMDRQYWAHLFDHVGRSLKNSNKHLEKSLLERVIAFFDWRFKVSEPLELQEFTFWLDAGCLDPGWRLDAYSKILDLGRAKDVGLSIEIETLNRLLPDHLWQVVECFAKITDAVDQSQGGNFYILADEAKPILKAGLNSEDLQIRVNAERARENLLRIGRFDFLEID